ncbi:hypothetical protein HY772_02985 [Candidatus Woesearchaeota archaeon]|nr:hypothetical protein [Candidatus Woesearchaeota archaeon]
MKSTKLTTKLSNLHLHAKHAKISSKKKFILLSFVLSIMFLSLVAVVYSQQTKYFFSLDQCRYIFREGSCTVDGKHCNANSYNYVSKLLNPKKDCLTPIEFNSGFTQADVDAKYSGDCEFVYKEGALVDIDAEAFDPDPEVGPAGKLVWTWFDPLDKYGKWQTKKGDAGRHDTKVKVSDGDLFDVRPFCIQVTKEVTKANSAPVLKAFDDVNVKQGDTVTLNPECSDPDKDEVVVKYSGWMTTPSKTADAKDVGGHTVTVTCSDPAGQKDAKTVKVTVNEVNHAPLITGRAVTVNEGDLVTLPVSAADGDGDKVAIEISDPVGNDRKWQTKKGDAGTYPVMVTANDGKTTTQKEFLVTVVATNRAPTLKVAADVTVNEGEMVTLRPVTSDADGDKVTVAYDGWMTTASKKTGYDDAGTYEVKVSATDGKSERVTHTVKVTVLNTNRPPKITKVYEHK